MKAGETMIEQGKIAPYQFTILVILFTVGSTILIIPSGLAFEAKHDAWISSLIGPAVGLIFVALYHLLGQRYPALTFVEIVMHTLGKWIGGAISLLYVFFFFILGALVLRNLGDFMTTQVLPNTPIQYIHILFVLVVISGVRNGLEVFTRTAEIFLPWVILFFLFLIVLLPYQFKLDNLLPVVGYGIAPVARAALPYIGSPYAELITLLVLYPYVSNNRKAGKAFAIGVLIAGFILFLIVMTTILVLGPKITAVQMFPSYILAKKISVGHFLERVEVIMAGIWFITIYFKLTICYYASTVSLAHVFKLKECRQLYLPLGFSLIVLSIISYPNTTYFFHIVTRIWSFYSLTFGVLLPLIILGLSLMRRQGAGSS
ncbi:GerAB/ArcD/ProY family transporter [Paenibacillus montanisoli]|uniref:Spore gernimation protein n=1 Tax=Paenibacillus montanisoli TaxID=2081970 RepID=A0A328U1V0_9BACL|nr:endospore germination permease [Paenibacillus montanisoli]RAP75743.1 spore gernimation protein [Paenibacillus montanisoli]